MKKRFTWLLCIVFAVIFSCVALTGCKKKSEEVQVKSGTIEINEAKDLLAVANYVGKEYSGYTILLKNDIDLSELGEDWTPIGRTLGKAFCGTFDGNGKTISGLKITGWENDGTPKYIAKEIIGWLDDGTPVYKSEEVITPEDKMVGNKVEDGYYELKKFVKEGEEEDPQYQKLADGKGVFEEDTSFGSVGLFGYTNGATIKNLTIAGADISFYTSGDRAYSGILSGYDVGSEFSDVKINDCEIEVSSIYRQYYDYDNEFGTPGSIICDNGIYQYGGGVVGYGKSDKFTDVEVNNFVFGNLNYSGYYDFGMAIKNTKGTGSAKDNILTVNRDEYFERGYNVTDLSHGNIFSNNYETYPKQVLTGGIAGYLSGAKLNKVKTNGYNNTVTVDEVDPTTLYGVTHIIAKSLYAGGISGCLYNSGAETIQTKDIYVNCKGYDLIKAKATIGGAFAEVSRSVVKAGEGENNSANNVFADLQMVTPIDNICMGGFAGYVDNKSSIEKINVSKIYFDCPDLGAGKEGADNIGSILAGAVGVLRNSSLKEATVSDITFSVLNGRDSSEAYNFTKCIVAQEYGNSTLSDSTAANVWKYTGENTKVAHNEIDPVLEKNHYVNEDGYNSARLYYFVNDDYSNVYVTVYGELIPLDKNGNLLYAEQIFKKTTDLGNKYVNGAKIDESDYGKYYRHIEPIENPKTKKVDNVEDKENGDYVLIWKDSPDVEGYMYKTFEDSVLYATKEDVYRVEFKSENIGKALEAGKYYEYDKKTASFTVTSDAVVKKDKTYYIYQNDEDVSKYYLDIKVYSESGNIMELSDGKTAEARYELSKDAVNNSVKKTVLSGKEYSLCNAEIYYGTYFSEGNGFKADINGKTIALSATNRNFAAYKMVSGRPIVNNILFN